MSVVKIVLTVLVLVICVALSHAALVIEDAFSIWRQLAVLVMIVPVAGLICWGIVMAMRSAGCGRVLPWLGGIAAGIFLCWLTAGFWSLLLTRLDLIYLIQHVGINSMLCWFFLQTLYGGRTPAITMIARTLHPDMPDSMVRYTRKVTVAWAIFFVMQVLVSLTIFWLASIETWSVFANVLNWPLVALMFAAEYICRKRCNPEVRHATLRESVTAYLENKDRI